MALSLAEVLRHFGPEYLRQHTLDGRQARVWRAIVECRTPALGGQRLQCEGCGATRWQYNSCADRHCPQCQSRRRQAWCGARMAELLDVPYCHLVFTLPHELNALAAVHARWVNETTMRCSAATLAEFAANPRWLGGIGSFTQVLHTWTQDLRRHIHVHALMACGALQPGTRSADATDATDAADTPEGAARWIAPRRSARFLFPVHALSKVFKGKFLQALRQASADGKLPRDPAASAAMRQQRMQALRGHDWVVYAKTPLAGPAAVLEYLSRYTHRTAIGNERLVAIEGDKVLVRVRADGRGGKRIVAIDGVCFIGRFLQHVLPPGFKRIRHYGLLAPALKAQRLRLARELLHMPQPNPRACEDARQFMQRVAAIDIQRCPHCPSGRWRVVETLPAHRAALAAIAGCRGPP
jgi:Putative transposase/Transposase zinc-binding domain